MIWICFVSDFEHPKSLPGFNGSIRVVISNYQCVLPVLISHRLNPHYRWLFVSEYIDINVLYLSKNIMTVIQLPTASFYEQLFERKYHDIYHVSWNHKINPPVEIVSRFELFFNQVT